MTAHDRPKSGPLRALVTGATGGIGLELARLLAADGFHLVLTGRRRDQLDRVAAELGEAHRIDVQVEPRDLSECGAASRLWNDLAASGAGARIDVLINNAGVGLYGAVEEQDPAELDRMVQLNVSALTTLARLALPGMRERRWGRILNLASVVAFQPGAPYMAAYYATKAYVLSLSKGLALELRGSGVSVTALAPGPTITEFQKRAKMEKSELISGKLLSVMDSESVARYGYRALMKGKTLAIPGFMNKAVAFSTRLAPRKLVTQIARKLQENKKH